MPDTRVNLTWGPDYQHICTIAEYLVAHGIDAKVVTSHAVQAHPEHVARATELRVRFKAWVEAQNEARRGVGVNG